MARNVHWTMRFRSLDDIAYRVDIFEEDYEGQPVVLLGGAQPFVTQETDDDDFFLPLRTSSGYLTLVIEDASVVDDILPQRMTDRYLELTDENSGKKEWIGYISPAQYSNVWDTTPYELQLPVLSPLAALGTMEYRPLGRWACVGEVLKNIFENHLGFLPEYVAIQILDDDVDTVPLLDHNFSDLRFARTVDYANIPFKGNNDGMTVDSYTVNDVLDAICRLCGYSILETPSRYWFLAQDASRKFAVMAGDSIQSASYFSVVEMDDRQLPDVISADGQKNILLAKKSVKLSAELDKVDDVWSMDMLASSTSSRGRWEIPDDKILQYFGRNNGHDYLCQQYIKRVDLATSSPDTPIPTPQDILADTWIHEGNFSFVGGMFISYTTGVKNDSRRSLDPALSDYSQYKNALLIVTMEARENPVERLIPAVTMTTPKAYSAVNFVQTGLLLKFNYGISNEYRDWKFRFPGGITRLLVQLKWGDRYYRGDPINGGQVIDSMLWQSEPCQFYVYVSTLDMEEADSGRAFNNDPIDDRGGFDIIIPRNYAPYMNGPIELKIFTPYASLVLGKAARILLTDISLSAPSMDDVSINDNIDDYREEYFEMLEGLGDEYEYKQPITHGSYVYSPSGVYEYHPSEYWENLFFDRLKRWYGRAVEQLTIDVQRSEAMPGVRYYRDGSIYLPVSRTVNWRDAKTTLTLQKHYET